MTAVIAVHCGAGYHNYKKHGLYNQLSKKACKRAIEVLKQGGTALEAVKIAIAVLEDNPLTNSGFGSNLTNTGFVETDASVMDGHTLTYGGCGAVRQLKNPIHLAYDLCIKQADGLPLGLIPPTLLVGKGALLHAKKSGLKIVSNKALVSPKAAMQFKKYKKMLEDSCCNQSNRGGASTEKLLDTVGAVCVDLKGHVAAGCSSGGILLKSPGRVGQAALYACGAWADSFSPQLEPPVAVCTSGCGEHLVQTQLAKELGEDLKKHSCPTVGLSKSMTEKFLNSRYLTNVKEKLGGALVLHVDNKTGDIAVLWGHTTESMSVGYMRSVDERPKSVISELPKEVAVGTTVNVSGAYFYKKKTD